MKRVRVAVSGLAEGELTLTREAAHYLVRVHRLVAADAFVAFDPELRLEADAELLVADERRARCRVHAVRAASSISPLRVTLLQGFGKADKIDQVVRDTTALGVAKIVVVETERSVVRLESSPERAQRREGRWRKIAAEAARQSGRGDVPEIVGPVPLEKALAEHTDPTEMGFFFDVGARKTLASALAAWTPGCATALLIGPEGGLSEREQQLAERAALVPLRLGPFTLRTETAATVVLGALFVRSALDYSEDPPETHD